MSTRLLKESSYVCFVVVEFAFVAGFVAAVELVLEVPVVVVVVEEEEEEEGVLVPWAQAEEGAPTPRVASS